MNKILIIVILSMLILGCGNKNMETHRHPKTGYTCNQLIDEYNNCYLISVSSFNYEECIRNYLPYILVKCYGVQNEI